VLEDAGYAVDVAENGKEAVEKTMTNAYNLALIDFRLPDMTGSMLITEMMRTAPRMVKIIVTGYPSLNNVVDAVNRGADGYVIKPFSVDELLNTVKKKLKKQEEDATYNEEKVAEFIETRAREEGFSV